MAVVVGARKGIQLRCGVRDALLARAAEGDEEQLLGPLEGMRERGGVVEAAPPDTDAAVGEVLGLAGIADAEAGAVGGNALQEAFGGATAELCGGSGHDDHGFSPRLKRPLLTTLVVDAPGASRRTGVKA